MTVSHFQYDTQPPCRAYYIRNAFSCSGRVQTRRVYPVTMDHHLPSKTGTSFFRTCFNGVNALSGFGILSIPYALWEGGWVSLTLLFVLAAVCFYTALLLQKCMDSNSLVRTYPDIGELAFGMKGRMLIALFMYLELFFVAIQFLIIEGDNLEKLFPNASFHIAGLNIGGKQGFVVLSALLILPTTWLRNLGVLAYVSVGGVLASLILVFSVIWVGAIDGVGFHERGVVMNWSGMPTALSLFAFCYSGHTVYPTIYSSMADKTKFSRVLLICFAIATINYVLMAILGYLMFGQAAKSQVTLNLPVVKISAKIAIYTTLINPLAKYALIVMPIVNAIEDRLQVSKNRAIGILIRTVLVITTAIVALSVPFFGYIVALTGSFLSSNDTMILPCLCYLKIFKRSRRWGLELVMILAVVVMGAFLAVVGTYVSMKQIIASL
ncbi:hypothetical protein KSP40_PGU016407 [Platanthera guangdongensis]|uniref:Amino acid transporter transmembrane domain-containing protein n=1 Tax=Platanthera guangdongensis TaxID=2320717 RepID=A0ABR2LR92_9ASPA